MASKSVCNAIFFLVAFVVTVTTGQYQILTTYTDNQCTSANGGVYITNTGPECYSDTNCNSVGGLYTKSSCVDTDPLLSLTTEATFVYYSTSDLSCNNFSTYTEAIAAPLGVCVAGTGYVVKLTGCEPGNNTFIYQLYTNLDNCNASIVQFEGDFVSGVCRPGQYDAVGTCQGLTTPPVAPVAPPVSPPITPPVASPLAPPTTAAPTSTPVASPVKKVNSATCNTMLGMASVAGLMLVWA